MSYDIKWGQGEKILGLIEKIALREGVKRISEKYDCEFAMQVKGLELPGYDSRGAVGQSLAYATNNEGWSHMMAPVYIDEILTQRIDRFEKKHKVQLVKDTQDWRENIQPGKAFQFKGRFHKT